MVLAFCFFYFQLNSFGHWSFGASLLFMSFICYYDKKTFFFWLSFIFEIQFIFAWLCQTLIFFDHSPPTFRIPISFQWIKWNPRPLFCFSFLHILFRSEICHIVEVKWVLKALHVDFFFFFFLKINMPICLAVKLVWNNPKCVLWIWVAYPFKLNGSCPTGQMSQLS